MYKFIALMLLSSVVSANSCVVLLYHHFSDTTPKSTSISPALFEQHLQYLKQHNFKVLKLNTMLDLLDSDKLPNKCVVLTADDAYQSIADNAYPLLKKYLMPMSVFVSTNPVDKKYNAMMSWQQMRQIQGNTIQFYNHSTDHTHFLSLNKREISTQIQQAQKRLNQELAKCDNWFSCLPYGNDTTPLIFAYPYGEASPAIMQQVRDLGFTAFGQQSGVVSKMSNRQNLPRFPMAAHYAKMPSFKTKVNTLPMPIKPNHKNPIFTQNPPTLTLTFLTPLNKHQKANLNCFANGGVEMTWNSNKSVKITAKTPLTARRSKYNCTMPSNQKNRYYWHSIQWINPKVKE
ncbi:polysaccharide deacetylase family protein [Bathymodiolus septemdierum thioautotrophic gill symbiont]|uniref:Polysaccharide deacetylase n=1 Tax=endosymbiont of Bathymodiolus septemdierum str. Myojin knoll TaxID=1303921 RepID=A0A0P0USL6_9GAMM|nr:polysaccharide deacetylase family protein [Bathymodiolus septemdierum thioautotrophic gill symbiont]BAS68141.1 polysaccharide deacetylase [endosymbiont of Bathymodiolus septemdierum str. Myojin knoll]